MRRKEVFMDIYEQVTGLRFLMIFALLVCGSIFLFFTNGLVKSLKDREEKYVLLYARGIENLIQEDLQGANYNFVLEILETNKTIPIIYIDDKGNPSQYLNIPSVENVKLSAEEKNKKLLEEAVQMASQNQPMKVPIDATQNRYGHLYYSDSFLLTQLRYFPIVLFSAMLILSGLAFMAYSSARKAEQNRVWVGLAKETAHQLGTPISALTGWVEFFKTDPNFNQEIIEEIEKDIKRLDTITTRFSSIGSVPTMKQENITELMQQTVSYLQKRISTKVNWQFNNQLSQDTNMELNRYLFEWVIENLCKNAVDAMGGIGNLTIDMFAASADKITIDITDSGKGISRINVRRIFKAGFSTKKRGWGLGLTLAKRIIENYHGGKLSVKSTELGKGTTFRIVI